MINYTFEQGETRKLGFRVCNNIENESIIIQSATWELRTTGREVVGSGVCTVSTDYIIYLVVPFITTGDFILKVTAHIPPETIKQSFAIRVVD